MSGELSDWDKYDADHILGGEVVFKPLTSHNCFADNDVNPYARITQGYPWVIWRCGNCSQLWNVSDHGAVKTTPDRLAELRSEEAPK